MQKHDAQPLQTGHHYYVEMAIQLAPSSGHAVPAMHLALLPAGWMAPAGDGQLTPTPLLTVAGGRPSGTLSGPDHNWRRQGLVFSPPTDMPGFRVVIGNMAPLQFPLPNGISPVLPSQPLSSLAYYFVDNVTLSMVTEAGPNVTLGAACLGGNGASSVALGTLPMPSMVGATYAWTLPNGTVFSTNPNPTVSPTQTTTYTLTVSIPVPGWNSTTSQPQTQTQTYTSSVTVTVAAYNYGQTAGATYATPPAGGAAYDIGAPGTTTVLSAGGGTVTFAGRYHVRGDVRLTNGTFRLQPGTVFFIDSDYTDEAGGAATRLTVDGATLRLSGATLQATCLGRRWDGVYLTNGGTLRSSAYAAVVETETGTSFNIQRSLVRDMLGGINSSAGNFYYLSSTDFVHNQVSLQEYALDKVALAGEGATDCLFQDGQYGILLSEIDYYSGHVFGGNYEQAQFTGNTFQELGGYGLYATAGLAHFTGNSFRRCGLAAIATWSAPQAGRAELRGNTIEVPVGTGAANSFGTGPVGIAAPDGLSLVTDNTITSASGAPTPSAAAPAPRVGILGVLASGAYGSISATSQQVSGNTLTGLDFGIAATLASQYPGSPGLSTLAGNTLLNNAVGISLAPGFLYPYSGAVPITVNLRCNSFVNDASSQVTNPIGLWIRQNAVINGGLNDQSNPNGNAFQFQTGQTQYIRNDGALQLAYRPYISNYEDGVLGANTGGTTLLAVSGGIALPPGGACQNSTAGVHNQRIASTAPVDFTTQLDSLRQADLLPAARRRLQQAVLANATEAGQLISLEAYLPDAAPDEARTLGLGLLAAYRLRHDLPGATRLRTRLHAAASTTPELAAYLRLTQALDEMPSLLPGLRPLRASARALLAQVAASGTSSAEPACRLLRAYEPKCACQLATSAATAARPTSAARAGAATSLLGAYPNPAGGTLHVPQLGRAGAGPAELRVYDATGRLVLRQPVSPDAREALVEVRAWAAGLYQLVLTHEGQVLGSQRLAVQPQP